MSTIDTIIWGISALLMILGVFGVVVPVLPGPFLIVMGVLMHKIFLPTYLSWWTVGGIIFLACFCIIIDWVCMYFGIKWSGASKWAIYGAGMGFFIGLFFGLPGIIIGPILGAAGGEYFIAKKDPQKAGIAGLGAGIGIFISTILRLILAFIMIAAFLVDCFWIK